MLIKKKLIVDEKELESFFKDLAGEENFNKQRIKKNEFCRLFVRPCFRGGLANLQDFIEKSTIILKNLPVSVKLLHFQRQLLLTGLFSMTSKSKSNLDGRIVLHALQNTEEGMNFHDVK